MVDALSSGGSVRKDVLVRIQSRAPNILRRESFGTSSESELVKMRIPIPMVPDFYAPPYHRTFILNMPFRIA